jgi:hypothetical protein
MTIRASAICTLEGHPDEVALDVLSGFDATMEALLIEGLEPPQDRKRELRACLGLALISSNRAPDVRSIQWCPSDSPMWSTSSTQAP